MSITYRYLSLSVWSNLKNQLLHIYNCTFFLPFLKDSSSSDSTDESGSDDGDTESQASSVASSPKKTQRAGQKRKAVPDNSEGL